MVKQLRNKPGVRLQLLDEGDQTSKANRIKFSDAVKVASRVVMDSNQIMIPRMI